MKEIKELNRWREIPCWWIGRLTVVNMSVLPVLMERFDAVPVKIPGSFFVVINKLNLKFIAKDKTPRMANTTLKKRAQIED